MSQWHGNESEQFETERALMTQRIGAGGMLRLRRIVRMTRGYDPVLRARRPLYGFALLLGLLSLVVGQPLLLITGVLVLILALLPEVWYRFGLRGMRISHTPGVRRVSFGAVIDIPIVIENRKPLPLPWIEVDDEFPDRLPALGSTLTPYGKPERALLIHTMSLWAYQRVRRHHRVWAIERGVYAFGPTRLRLSDPFGILTREGESQASVRMIVHPLVAPLERFGLSPRAPFGDRKAAQRLLEDPLRTIGVRDYHPGDEPRRVHWQATARMGTLQSKVYEPSARHTLMIFLDTRTYSNPTIGYDPQRVELVISAAASIAVWGLREGYAVGLVSNGSLGSPELDDPQLVTASPFVPLAPPSDDGQERDEATALVERSHRRQAPPPLSDEELEQRLQRAVARLRLRIPPNARPEQATLILDGLARLLPYYGVPMSQLIASEQRNLPTGATIVYIGAESVVDVQTIVALRQMRARGYFVSLLLTTTESTSTADLGNPFGVAQPLSAPSESPTQETPFQARRHEVHLSGLPMRFIGGRTRWQELVTMALGASTHRLATAPLSADELKFERDLVRAAQAMSSHEPAPTTDMLMRLTIPEAGDPHGKTYDGPRWESTNAPEILEPLDAQGVGMVEEARR